MVRDEEEEEEERMEEAAESVERLESQVRVERERSERLREEVGKQALENRRLTSALARALRKSGTSRISASTGMGWVACADPAARRAESLLRYMGMRREFGWNSTLALVSRFENIPPEVLAHEATPPRWVANASVAVVLLGHSAVPMSIAIRTGARRGPPARAAPSVPAWPREKHGKSGV